MKIFITGINGFVGSNLAEFYSNRGDCVKGFLRGENLQEQLNTYKPDLILHCAAEIYDVESMLHSNIELTQQCVDYLKQNTSTAMIYFGSSSEYGWRTEPTNEHSLLIPDTAYAATKAAGSLICQGYAKQFELDITVLRLYSIYGPGEKPHRLFPKLFRSFYDNQPMSLNEGVHDFVYIKDLIQAVNLIEQCNVREPGEIYNICSGQQTSNQDVLDTFKNITGLQGNVTKVEGFGTPPVWQGNYNKIQNKFNWQPNFDLHQGIADFIKHANY